MAMTGSPSRLPVLALAVYWSCVLLGLSIPGIATIAVDVLKHDQSVSEAVRQLRLHLFAPGHNLFLIALMNAAPFVVFAIFSLFHLGLAPLHDRTLFGRRSFGVVFSAIGLVATSAWTHVTTLWYPDAQGALAYLFLPLVLLVLMPVGYAAGRALGCLIFR
jgi:hypothetical protein